MIRSRDRHRLTGTFSSGEDLKEGPMQSGKASFEKAEKILGVSACPFS